MTVDKARKPKVFWTHEETSQVVREALQLHIGPQNIAWNKALKIANSHMPRDRQITESTLYNRSKSLFDMAIAIRDRLTDDELDNLLDKAPADSVSSTEDSLTVSNEASLIHTLHLADVSQPSLDSAIELVANSLCNLLVPKFKERLQCKLKQVLISAVTELEQDAEDIVTKVEEIKEKQKKPKVFVIGLFAQQITTLKQEFGTVFDLTVHGVDENVNLIRPRASGADYVVVNTTKISHKHWDHIKAVKPKNLIQVNGDLTVIKQRLAVLQKQLSL